MIYPFNLFNNNNNEPDTVDVVVVLIIFILGVALACFDVSQKTRAENQGPKNQETKSTPCK